MRKREKQHGLQHKYFETSFKSSLYDNSIELDGSDITIFHRIINRNNQDQIGRESTMSSIYGRDKATLEWFERQISRIEAYGPYRDNPELQKQLRKAKERALEMRHKLMITQWVDEIINHPCHRNGRGL